MRLWIGPVLAFALVAGCGARSELDTAGWCGNGVQEDGEACDDGNRIEHDACDNACLVRTCGNGVLDAPELCDLGADNGDRPALQLTHGSLERAVMPVDRALSMAGFYGYASESSHTGFERATLSALFLYRNTTDGSLGLVIHHGIDEDASGITLPHGLVQMNIVGVPSSVGLVLSDEGDELVVDASKATGNWEFWRNSDGGALGPFPFPGNWSIEIAVRLLDGIDTWEYITADASAIALDAARVAVLTAFDSPSACRTDCTIPTCGDSIVDGGEVCDDGNTDGDDGCNATCTSLFD
jgi:cysteine-rich repeat protein